MFSPALSQPVAAHVCDYSGLMPAPHREPAPHGDVPTPYDGHRETQTPADALAPHDAHDRETQTLADASPDTHDRETQKPTSHHAPPPADLHSRVPAPRDAVMQTPAPPDHRDRAAVQTPAPPDPRDRDGDGVSDRAERRQHTDPEVPGLFPGAYPHIPEPLRFDLVRGLGARRGEFEANVLMSSTGPFDGLHWAPEIEWAFADRHALEFEIPMHNRNVEALKIAVQGTFREQYPVFIHGWQFIGEGVLAGAGEFTAIYIAGRRFGSRFSMLGMLGPSLRVDAAGLTADLVLNPSVFFDVGERTTIGLENIARLRGKHSQVTTLPQIHVQLGRHFRLQAGTGVVFLAGSIRPTFSLRLVIE